ncbi:phosphoesterase [Candidatus Koribacter versatilis Ellin345]|uniref:Phosphoesterase n=1 Tax=Koribacter versatilis (strain Ellin345) TaxID=204669 RepID=Q1II99_KORVE|nr:phosphoesterase [Candidatus Koribacter versatilis]ABF43401.1 phosphoesterase [Candidatus Koribacter versatilis Ellin345]
MRIVSALTLSLLLCFAACGGNSSNNGGSGGSGGGGSASVPQFQHVAIVVLENASYHDVIGNTQMPWLSGLAGKYASLQSYYANAHPSIPNYFMLTTGQTITFDDAFSNTVSSDNLARDITSAGLTWKAYEESIPAAAYTGASTGLYIERHDPFSYFSDVRGTAQANNIVPSSQLSADIGANSLPNFLWITPNALNSAHSCPASNANCTLNDRLAAADAWLSANVQPLLSNSEFASNGLLIVVFDEGDDTDLDHGGGHVVCVLAGAHVKQGYTSSATYQHQDVLSLIGHALKLSSVPGAGATGGTMTEFFQ